MQVIVAPVSRNAPTGLSLMNALKLITLGRLPRFPAPRLQKRRIVGTGIRCANEAALSVRERRSGGILIWGGTVVKPLIAENVGRCRKVLTYLLVADFAVGV